MEYKTRVFNIPSQQHQYKMIATKRQLRLIFRGWDLEENIRKLGSYKCGTEKLTVWFRANYRTKKKTNQLRSISRQQDTANIIHCAKRKRSKNKFKLSYLILTTEVCSSLREVFVACVVGNRKARFIWLFAELGAHLHIGVILVWSWLKKKSTSWLLYITIVLRLKFAQRWYVDDEHWTSLYIAKA